MMAKASPYAGRRVALLTQHGKEAVISPVLEPGLGCIVEHVTGFDTDLLGTFTRETPRPGTQLEAARRKARKGMALSGLPLGMASEGSFGPDPYTGLFPWNIEILVWIDDVLGIECVGMAQGAARSGHLLSADWSEIESFASKEGFPQHQLVLRPDGEGDPRIRKDIADWARLKACFDACQAESRQGMVFVELDLRAFANPSRMRHIELAAGDLLRRIQSACPSCEAPGFWITERQPGLPCSACGLPTTSYRAEVWSCVRCDHRPVVVRQDRIKADPKDCRYCNP